MINLTYKYWELEPFRWFEDDCEYICKVLWDAGYNISPWDAFCAWFDDCNGDWEAPWVYSEDEIVDAILDATFEDITVWPNPEEDKEIEIDIISEQFPYINEWIEDQLDDYEPKRNARSEGVKYDPDTNSFEPSEAPWKY